MYHHELDVPISFPADEAIIPRVVKVIAVPTAKVTDSLNAFFVSFCPVPPTYPIISGTFDNAHGVTEVIIPAINANSGEIQILSFIVTDKLFNKLSINHSPPFR